MAMRMTVGGRAGTRPPTATRPLGLARDERGAVTAEAAAVLPVLVALALGLVWVVGLAVAQVRLVDAGRDVAREVARGDDTAVAVGAASRQAPGGSTFEVRTRGDRVVVRATAEVKGPGGLFSFLPGVHLESIATTAREPG
jgi:Flp pilus assembly protein TadG